MNMYEWAKKEVEIACKNYHKIQFQKFTKISYLLRKNCVKVADLFRTLSRFFLLLLKKKEACKCMIITILILTLI